MRVPTLITGLLSIASTSVALSEVFESLRAVPQGWTEVGDPKPETRLHLRIALKQPNPMLLEQTLLAVSTPDHARYGQHLKRDELKALLKPADESTDAVLTWLQASGVAPADIDNDGGWVHFYVSVARANAMMETEFHYYGNPIDQSMAIRTLQYSVPANVSDHITMIQPTTRFNQVRAQRSNVFDVALGPAAAAQPDHHYNPQTYLNVTACNQTITPDCLRALYNVDDYEAIPSVGSLFGVCGYLEQYAKFDDLATFLTKYASYAEGANFSYVLVNGGLDSQNDPTHDDGEANLDIQYAVPLSYKTPINYYSTGGRGILVPDNDQPDPNSNSNEPYLDFLHYILAQETVPQTITTSYGEDEQSVPASYAKEVCNLFGQLGARGVSILFSSGDTGVGSACETNDGKNVTRFLPTFPAACPYVTSVGATYRVKPERAVSFSSGGFSDLFPRPSYQENAVSDYLKILGDQWKGLYNPNGRGFPDVAAQGVRFHVIDKNGGTTQLDEQFSGTSASSPTFAAIVSLLNNARLANNMPPLGFLNPWIYSVGRHALEDIVDGGSKGCTGTDQYSGLPTPYVPYASWNATKGWDPVTGYGTPKFKYLLHVAVPGAKWNSLSGN